MLKPTVTQILNSWSDFLWIPQRFDLAQIDETYKDYDEDIRIHTIVFFDINTINEVVFEEFLEDTFCDGIPVGLDFQKHIPFALIGSCDGEIQNGDINQIIQPNYMLLLDLESKKDAATPVLMLEIDGTVNDNGLVNVAGDLSELMFSSHSSNNS